MKQSTNIERRVANLFVPDVLNIRHIKNRFSGNI